ncbi:GPP34 family phosphoprotein [Streptomyces sp. H27-H1]|uniref:GPP34 family phosphoprotein n=1 Tax=Streptomyces sp. H27-H1 TaxID=2996461 RepID=UPI00227001C3|nr:GPP34 family phosphoprotein [Streptomyces sp. H27-H1]MCY0932266.1 GPP34 family phosphoprotein [Streptomyces sp. H27-H1]
MSTAKDLFIIAMDERPGAGVGQGDLSLVLAGAELIDLLAVQAAVLDDDSIVPGGQYELHDELMTEAASALIRQVPYEKVEDWLWRRGRELSATYQAALEEAGQLTRGRRALLPFGNDRLEVAETPVRRRARSRWEAGEPILTALAAAVGIAATRPEDGGEHANELALEDEAVTTVLAIINEAVMELEAVRQRRSIEHAAFANVWRVP